MFFNEGKKLMHTKLWQFHNEQSNLIEEHWAALIQRMYQDIKAKKKVHIVNLHIVLIDYIIKYNV